MLSRVGKQMFLKSATWLSRTQISLCLTLNSEVWVREYPGPGGFSSFLQWNSGTQLKTTTVLGSLAPRVERRQTLRTRWETNFYVCWSQEFSPLMIMLVVFPSIDNAESLLSEQAMDFVLRHSKEVPVVFSIGWKIWRDTSFTRNWRTSWISALVGGFTICLYATLANPKWQMASSAELPRYVVTQLKTPFA